MTKNCSGADWIPATAVAVTGIAEFSHLCGVFLNRSFHFCALLFGGLATAAILLSAVIFLAAAGKKRKKNEKQAKRKDGAEKVLLFLFVILVETENITVVNDFLLCNEERFVVGGSFVFRFKIIPTRNNIGNVVGIYFISLLVERIAVRLHIVKPYFIRAAGICLGKHKNTGLNTRIRLEYTVRHINNYFEFLFFYELRAKTRIRFFIRVVQDAYGDNGNASSACFQKP